MSSLLFYRQHAVTSRMFTVAMRCLHNHLICQTVSRRSPQLVHQSRGCKVLSSSVPLEKLQQTTKFGHARFVRTFSNMGNRQLKQEIVIPLFKHGNRVIGVRFMSSQGPSGGTDKTDALLYVLSVLILSVGLAYAGVPFFKMFCRQFGLGGNPEISKGHDRSKVSTMSKVEDREITVRFNADTHAAMKWNFKPQQSKIKVKPGETALAFYTAENPTDKPIVGISTYTVTPYIAAPYFNKIQCFCFEEQILNPHEQVDMPVFFYIDPEYDEDPQLEFEDSITLSYTFFEAKEGMSLPLPGFIQPSSQSDKQPTGNVS